MRWGGRCLELGGRTLLMGIVNVTPDSFSDGGLCAREEDAVAHGLALAEAGADILDVGGESTRPFAEPVAAAEEIRRVVPVIARLAERVSVPISVDTAKAEVARRALEAGASIVNDVTALTGDLDMAGVAAEAGVPVVLMHMPGTPRTMQVDPRYTDVVAEVRDYLAQAMERAVAAGIRRDLLFVDPGAGFGKTVPHNLLLIRNLAALEALGAPVVLAHSRKSFIKKTLAEGLPEGAEPSLDQIVDGTLGIAAAAAFAGVHVIRAHDMARVRAAVRLADALRMAGE
jgi:dihydropteroate synthase